MKNLKRLLFTFVLAFVSVFAIGNVSALTGDQITKIYIPSDKTNIKIVNGGDKANISILTGDALNAQKASFDEAANNYYGGNAFGDATHGYVQIVPLKVEVTGDLQSSYAEFYIEIPKDFLRSHANIHDVVDPTTGKVIKGSLSKIQFARVWYGTFGLAPNTRTGYIFDPGFMLNEDTAFVDANNDAEWVYGYFDENGNFAALSEENANGKYYAKIKSNFIDNSDVVAPGTYYYGLVICHSSELPTEPPVEPTTTTTTTVPNPQTLDGNNTMYIVLGVIGLIGIIGLGSKFAKSSK